MKKLLGLLALAPLTIVACGDGDTSAGGKSMLTHLTSENTIEEIELYIGSGAEADLTCFNGDFETQWYDEAQEFVFYQVNAGGGTHTIVYAISHYNEWEGWLNYIDPKGYLRTGTIADRVSVKTLTWDWCI